MVANDLGVQMLIGALLFVGGAYLGIQGSGKHIAFPLMVGGFVLIVARMG